MCRSRSWSRNWSGCRTGCRRRNRGSGDRRGYNYGCRRGCNRTEKLARLGRHRHGEGLTDGAGAGIGWLRARAGHSVTFRRWLGCLANIPECAGIGDGASRRPEQEGVRDRGVRLHFRRTSVHRQQRGVGDEIRRLPNAWLAGNAPHNEPSDADCSTVEALRSLHDDGPFSELHPGAGNGQE